MRLGWLAALAAMTVSTQADAARWVRFTFTGPGELLAGNVNDLDPPPLIRSDIRASFTVDVEPNDPFDGSGDPSYFSNGSVFDKFSPFNGFSVSVGAGAFEVIEKFTDIKALGDSRLTFTLTNGATRFADVVPGVGGGTLRYEVVGGFDYQQASASLTRIGVSDATGYEMLRVTAVPEPATWAMMIVGFGAAGAQLRRKRAGAAAAVA